MIWTERSGAAQRFLERFREASAQGDALKVINGDWSGFGDAVAEAPHELKDALESDAQSAPAGPAFIVPSSFGSAACDREGRIVVADAKVRLWTPCFERARIELRGFEPCKARITFLLHDDGRFDVVAIAAPKIARQWPLADEVRTSLEEGRARFALIATGPVSPTEQTSWTPGDLFGFTVSEMRFARAFLMSGDVRKAATSVQISYETARDVLKAIMRKAGVRRQGEFITLCAALQAGETPANVRLEGVLQYLFALSARQAHAALLIAQGYGRRDAARELGVSESVVKDEMRHVYAACLTPTAAALAGLVAQVRALSAFAEAGDVDASLMSVEPARLRLLPRPERAGRIAFTDHGPPNGVATLILHTATTSRHNPTCFISALQACGLRPIALDRPGFGLTDMVEGDYLVESARDLVDVMNALRLARACVIARGGAMVLSRFAALHPDRLDRAVVINPEPPASADAKTSGPAAAVKALVYRRPELIEALAGHLSRRVSAGLVEALVLRMLEASPADRAVLNDDAVRSAYVKATQQCALQGGAGFAAVARCEPAEKPSAIADGSMITILCGGQDPLYDAADSLPRWKAVWPGCRVEIIAEAGRLLHLQYPQRVAEMLSVGRDLG